LFCYILCVVDNGSVIASNNCAYQNISVSWMLE